MSRCACGCGQLTPIAKKTKRSRGHIKGLPTRFIHNHHLRGATNTSWKGDRAGYTAIHNWLRRHYYKAGRCERCYQERPTQYANISGEYRRDRDDYLELCVSCHRIYDNSKRREGPCPSMSSLS